MAEKPAERHGDDIGGGECGMRNAECGLRVERAAGQSGTCASVLFGLWTPLNGRILAGELFDSVGRATGVRVIPRDWDQSAAEEGEDVYSRVGEYSSRYRVVVTLKPRSWIITSRSSPLYIANYLGSPPAMSDASR